MSRYKVQLLIAKHLVVLSVLALIPMLWYGDKLISTIGLDLQTSPIDFLNTVFYGWQSKSSLGTSFNASGWIFPSSTYFSILSYTGVPNFLIVRSWYVLILLLAGISMYSYINYLLTNHYHCDDSVNKCERVDCRLWCSLVGAVGYIANPYVVMHYDNGHFLIPYAILPLQLLIVAKGLKSGSLYYAVLLAISSVLVTTNLPIVFINYIVIALFAIWYIRWFDGKELARKRRFALVSILLISLNLLWYIVPTLMLVINNDPTLAEAVAQESWEMYGRNSSFYDTFRLLGIWGLYAGGYDYSNFYLNNVVGIVATYLLPIAAFLPFIFFKNKILLYFPLFLILLSLFMAIGGYSSSPFKSLYIYFYENIPLFSMLRNGYKFVGVMAFSYVALIAVFLYWLIDRSVIKISTTRARNYCLTAIALFMLSAFPLFSGQMFNDKNLALVPSYWKDASIWLNEHQGEYRVVLFPDQYFETYKWGGWGGFHSSVPYLSQDMVFNNPTKSGNELIQALYSKLAEDTNPSTHKVKGDTSEKTFCKILPLLNVRYVIQRDDIDTSVYKVSTPKKTKHFLDSQECIKHVVSFGDLYIYELKQHYLPRIYVPDQSYYLLKTDASVIFK